MPTVTQAAYLRRVLDRLYPTRVLRYGTASGSGSTTTVVYAAGATTFTQTSSLVGQWIRTTTSGTTEYSLISSVAANGTMTVDRAITSTTSSTTFEITYDRHPAQLEQMINQVLANTYAPRLFPLSSHIITNDDNDMESTATITGMWSNTNGTLAKSTTVVPLLGGLQSLSVTATSTPGYARLFETINVTVGEQYHASVLSSVTTGDSGEFRIVDVDNSNATIENATTDELTWNELSFYFTPPSGCERIDAWLMATTNTDVVFFDDLSIIRTNQEIFPVPSWFNWESQFLDVIEFPRGNNDPSADNGYLTLDRRWRSVGQLAGPGMLRSNQEFAIQITSGYTGSRRYIYAFAPQAELTTNASVGYIDVDIMAENVCTLIDAQESEGGRMAYGKHLTRIRETSLRSQVSLPKKRAMAYFA